MPVRHSSSLRADAPEFVPGRPIVSALQFQPLSDPVSSSENNGAAGEHKASLPLSQQGVQRTRNIASTSRPPPSAWVKPGKPRSWEMWQLRSADLRRGLLTYLKPNGTWHGGHPAIIRDTDGEGNVSVFTGTSFSESGGTIWRKFEGIRKPAKHREHCHDYLLIDDGETEPHYRLPLLQLENGEKLSKTTYVSMVAGSATVKKEGLARWSHGKKFGNYHITAASMDAAEAYFRWYTAMQAEKKRRAEEARQQAMLSEQGAQHPQTNLLSSAHRYYGA